MVAKYCMAMELNHTISGCRENIAPTNAMLPQQVVCIYFLEYIGVQYRP